MGYLCTRKISYGPFVYRLGREIFIKSSSTLLGTTSKIKEENKDGKSQIIIEENPSGQG